MVGIEGPTTDSIDLRRDNKPDAGAQVDASVSTLGAVFGTASFPPDMSEEIKAAILERAEQERALAGEMVMGTPSTTLTLQAKEEQEERTREEFAATWTALERQQEIQKQNEAAWLQSSHTYAGQTLSGEDWEQMRKWFGDEENVAAWEDAMMAETGQSRDEVRRTGGKMKRFYDLMDKDKKGTLTQAERDEFKRLNEDRDVKRGVQVQQQMQEAHMSKGYDQDGQSVVRADSDQSRSVAARVATYDENAPKGLAAVANLKPSYDAALAATQPPPAELKPVGIATGNKVQVSPDNMFG